MKTFKQFCDESTATDRYIENLRRKFDKSSKEGNIKGMCDATDRMGEINQKCGTGSLKFPGV